ncbi:carboxymuconolactone decarboxylase family protein, partial [Escherichia coli]|nr:carboxymuconolactone decarboxylase family protein [Escherichia coli]
MECLQTIKGRIPDYAKDIRLNLDGTIARSSLEGNDAVGVALAA